ncbi:MAG: Hpt domain-containing protein [Planctomycetaceae bacterium]
MSSIFRTIHTIKGTSGFLAFPKLEHVTHVGENLLVQLRDGELRLNGDIATGLLSMVDAVRSILGHGETVGSEGDDEFEGAGRDPGAAANGRAGNPRPPTGEPGGARQSHRRRTG